MVFWYYFEILLGIYSYYVFKFQIYYLIILYIHTTILLYLFKKENDFYFCSLRLNILLIFKMSLYFLRKAFSELLP